MRRLGLLLLLLAAPLGAQHIPPGRAIGIMKEAKAQLDSIAKLTRTTRVEQAACVRVSIQDDSTYVIVKVGPARNIMKADSLNIFFANKDMCDWWQPWIHSHVWPVETPSEDDQYLTAVRGTFGFVLAITPDGWKLKAYP